MFSPYIRLPANLAAQIHPDVRPERTIIHVRTVHIGIFHHVELLHPALGFLKMLCQADTVSYALRSSMD